MLTAVLLGVVLGVGSSVVPGPCSLAVVTAALRHGRARALATAAGVALADATCAALGVVGLGAVLARHPDVPPVLRGLSGTALVVYGIASLRRRPSPRAVAAPSSGAGHPLRGVGAGFATLAGTNPAAVVTWVVTIGAFLAGATTAEGCAAAVGVGVGSGSWYALIARLAARGAHGGGVQRVAAGLGWVLVASGLASLAMACAG